MNSKYKISTYVSYLFKVLIAQMALLCRTYGSANSLKDKNVKTFGLIPNLKLIIIIWSLLFIVSCEEPLKVSDVPYIEFRKIELQVGLDEELGNAVLVTYLEFYFIDGDADIGVADTAAGTNNIFLHKYYKIDGDFTLRKGDTIGKALDKNDKMSPIGQNKTIEGIIKLEDANFFLPSHDTMYVEFYIVDRAGHRSNMEISDTIVVTDSLKAIFESSKNDIN